MRLFFLNILFVIALYSLAESSEIGSPRILNVGHRGDPQHCPENTMMSFESAVKYGADGFETDLRLTMDHVIVLSHEEDLKKNTNCTGKISEKTYKELMSCDAGMGEHIPTFQEAVEFAKEQKIFIVMDLKVEGLGKYIFQVITPLEMEGSVIASCWTDTQIEDISKYLNITIKQKLGQYPLDWNEEYFREIMSRGVSAFSLMSTLLDIIPFEFIRDCHEHGIIVYAWTINDPIDMFLLVDRGIDGIITNNVENLKIELDELHYLLFKDGPPKSFFSKYQYQSDVLEKHSYPLVIGHRGDSQHYPENTLSAFLGAAKNGANGFETDLHLTKDGFIVLCHDSTLDRTTNCSGKIIDWMLSDILKNCDAGSWFSKQFIGERIPTFDQTLKLAKDNNLLIVMDMKENGLVPSIKKSVEALDMESRVIASCRNTGQVENVKKYLNATLIQQLSNPPKTYDETWWINELKIGYKSLSYDFSTLLTPEFIKSAHKHAIFVVSWVSNDIQHMYDGYQYGHDAIMSNDPLQLHHLISEVRKRVFPL